MRMSSRYGRVLSVLVVAGLVVSAATAFAATRGSATLRPSAGPNIVRLAGPDRYRTSARISREGWNSSSYVILATGEAFPDALAGAPLAYAYEAPLLLTSKASLPASISAEITRLGATKAIILGSPDAVSSNVASQVAGLVGAGHVERIGGANRYDTARKIALKVRAEGGVNDRVVVATGLNYPDALAVAGWAAYMRYPILLTKTDTLPPETRAAVATLAPAGAIVVGGPTTVSDGVKNALPSAIRLAGATRYETARVVAEYAAANGCSFSNTFLATGGGFADALGGAAMAARRAGVMLLTTQGVISLDCEDCLIDHRDELGTVYILGSTSTIGSGVSGSVNTIMNASGPRWSKQRSIGGGATYSTFRRLATAQEANGDLHVIWQADPLSVGMTYRKLDRWGNTLIAPVKLPLTNLQSGGSVESQPAVAVSDEGTVTVLWRVTGTGEGIWALQLDKQGRVARGLTQLWAGPMRFIKADYDGLGVLHVVTRDDLYRPRYARFNGDLSPNMSWRSLSGIKRYYLTRTPTLVARHDGSADVVWYDWRDIWPSGNHYGKYQIYHSRISVEGTATTESKLTSVPGGFTEAEVTGSNTSGNSWAPGIDLDAAGNVNLGWINAGDDIWFGRIGANGIESVQETKVVDSIASGTTSMKPMVGVARRNAGEVDLVYPFWNPATNLVRLYCAAVNPGTGAKLSTPLRVSNAESYPGFLELHAHAGEARLVYSGPGGGGSGENLWYLDSARDAAAFDKSRCDLVVDDAHSTNVSQRFGAPREREPVTMTVKVTNAGWAASPQTTATFSYKGKTFATVKVPTMAVDGSCTVRARWTVPGTMTVSPQFVRVSVDPSGTVVENSETNNTVDHLVPISLRPTGLAIGVHLLDDSWDPTHTADAITEMASATVTVRGTTATDTGRPPAPFRQTKTKGAWAFFTLPPGSYTVTATAQGYNPMKPRSVAISRSATDAYVIKASGDVTRATTVDVFFNTWGGLVGTFYDDNGTPGAWGDDTPIAGASIKLLECDRTAVTDASGAYRFARLPAGVYSAYTTADSHEAIQGSKRTISVGATATFSPRLAETTKAYIDVLVIDHHGSPMSDAEIRIYKPDNSFVATFTDATGFKALTVQAAPATQYRVEARTPNYVTDTRSAFTPGPGRRYPYKMELEPVTTAGSVSSDWGRWVTYSDHYQAMGNDFWGFYRNFHNRYDLTYTDMAGTRYITGLTAFEKGLAFKYECAAWAVDLETPYGPLDVGLQIATPYPGDELANARVEAVKLIDSSSGDVLYDNREQWYSHTAFQEENMQSYEDLVDAGRPDGVPVTWSTLEVWQWVTVNKAVPGEDGAAGYEHSSYQHWSNADEAVVIWTPSTNKMRIEPWVRDP
jgi:putative cell wall-binding protein